MADDLTGKVKHVGGKLQEAAGDLLGDSELKRRGKLTQIEGEAEQDESRAEDAVLEANARKNAAKLAKDAERNLR